MLRSDSRRSRRSHQPVCLLAILLLLVSALDISAGSSVKSVPETDSFEADPLPEALAGGNYLILTWDVARGEQLASHLVWD